MIKLIKSSFYNEIDTKEKLSQFILDSNVFSMNNQCANFETEFSKKQNTKYSVFVNSGSSANLILIQSLLNNGVIKKGDKIGFSSLTWATNIMPIIQLGLEPIPLDCSLKTLNTPPEELEKNIDGMKALFLTNVLGFCDNIEEIKKICNKNNIILIEDNCESLGSSTNKTLLGNFGIASTFSFFIGHHLSTIEGGMICTNDESLRDALIMTRAHGWDRNLERERQYKLRTENNVDEFYSKYMFYDLAFNVRPTEINGFIGNIQINYWNEIVNKRQDNFNKFKIAIENNDDFLKLDLGHMDIISNFAMPIICKDSVLFEKYKNRFLENNVEIRPIIAGNMENQPFYKKYVSSINRCKNADFIHKNGFYFGNNPELNNDEIELLCRLLTK